MSYVYLIMCEFFPYSSCAALCVRRIASVGSSTVLVLTPYTVFVL